MRLLIITGFWPTAENSISGVFVAQQAKAIARLNCEVRVVHVKSCIRRVSRALLAEELGCEDVFEFDEVSVINLPEKLLQLPGAPRFNTATTGFFISRYILQIKRAGWFPDAVLVHGMRYIGFSAPYWRPLIDGRVVQVVHGVDPKLEDQRTRQRFGSLIASSAQCFNSIIAVGRSLLTYVTKLGIQEVSMVPNGTDVPPSDLIGYSQRSLSARRVLLSVSNLNVIKGIDLNLQALAIIARTHPHLEWEYRIIGDGPERSGFESLAVDLGIASRVCFLGRLSYAETMNEMIGCDVFCLPSWGEAFGIVYLEAMARGRPVIGCWRNGAQDIFANETDGLLVVPQDVASLLSALVRLLSDPKECSRLGRNARAKAEQFTWDANALRMLDILGLNVSRSAAQA